MEKRQELYRKFTDFVRRESQRERFTVNRRVLAMILWCFILPLLAAGASLVMIREHILPIYFKLHLGVLIVGFPVVYTVYIFGAEVMMDLVRTFREGGTAVTLNKFTREAGWRSRIAQEMQREVPANPTEWRWILKQFETDLEGVRFRTRYLTFLAGAVFYLIVKGIDVFMDSELKSLDNPFSDVSQFAGLALLLMLLYLSGIQTYQSLKRFQNCIELVLLD